MSWRRTVPSYNRSLLRVAAEQGVPAVDVRQLFHDRYPDLFADESHFTLDGHAALGAYLAQELARQGALPPRS